MKKTIKEDNNRQVINSIYLNDNSLLEYVKENDTISVVARYIKDSRINEVTLTYTNENDINNVIRFNEDNSFVAIFSKNNDNYVLTNIYDTKENSYVDLEFIDIVFEKKFNNLKLNKHLVLK